MVDKSVAVEKDVFESVLEMATSTKLLLRHCIGHHAYTVFSQEKNDDLRIVVYETDLVSKQVREVYLRCDLRLSEWCQRDLKLAQKIGLTQELIDQELNIDSALIDGALEAHPNLAWVCRVRRIHNDIAVVYCLGYVEENTDREDDEDTDGGGYLKRAYVLRYKDMEYRVEVEDYYHSINEVSDMLCKMVDLGVRASVIRNLK